MPDLVAQLLPFTSAATLLVGNTLQIRQLQPRGLSADAVDRDKLRLNLVPLLVELFTIAAICALAAEGGQQGGVFKGAFVGTLAALIAYALPKLYMRRVLDKFCAPCTPWGRIGLGALFLVGLLAALMVLNGMILRS